MLILYVVTRTPKFPLEAIATATLAVGRIVCLRWLHPDTGGNLATFNPLSFNSESVKLPLLEW